MFLFFLHECSFFQDCTVTQPVCSECADHDLHIRPSGSLLTTIRSICCKLATPLPLTRSPLSLLLNPFKNKFASAPVPVILASWCHLSRAATALRVMQQCLAAFHLGAILQASTQPPLLLTPQPWQSLQPGGLFHPQGGVTPRDQVLCDLVYLFNNVLRSAPCPIWTLFYTSAFRLVLTAAAPCTTPDSLDGSFLVLQLSLLLAPACHAKAAAAGLC